jgi:GTP-binding protein HflX
VTQRQPDPAPGAEPERGFVVAVLTQGVDAERELAELAELARTAGVEPIGELVQHRARVEPRTYVGKGKLVELKDAFARSGADSLLVDDELSPVQQRELENALEARVIDRTQLILDIFAQHAVTAEGKLQVELAQLEYNLPRMRGLWQHLERLGGGVGTRGPGESQLETDRRLARRRISVLRNRLRGLERQRATRRKSRRRSETPVVALAGYTNAGKSTLLNALTGADVSVRDRLFETLDPTTRGFELDGRKYLVTDTVGFIRRLPHQLVEGFAATLEETLVADLLLHVVDGSASDEAVDEMRAAVEGVLAEIGVTETPVELVVNKVDLVDPLRRRRLANRFPEALQVSAETGEGLAASTSGSRASACCSRTIRAPGWQSSTLWARRSRSASTSRRASSSVPTCRDASSLASRRTCSPRHATSPCARSSDRTPDSAPTRGRRRPCSRLRR